MKILRICLLTAILITMPLMVFAASTKITFTEGSRYVSYPNGNYIGGKLSRKNSQYVVLYNSKGKLLDYKKTDSSGKFDFYTGNLKKGNNIFYVKSLKAGSADASPTYKVTLNYAEQYTVYFNAMGGKGKMSPQKISVGKATRLRKNTFTRDGYTFVGWATADTRPIMNGTDVTKYKNISMLRYQLGLVRVTNGQAVKNLTKANKKITLYAVWKGSGPQAAVDWAKLIARDDNFAYGTGSTAHRTGCYYCGTNVRKKGLRYRKTWCCNPFITAAYVHGANIKNDCGRINGTFFGGMEPRTWTCYNSMRGAKGTFKKINVRGQHRPGDIFMSGGHVWMFVKGGQYVEAGAEGWGANTIRVVNGSPTHGASYSMRYYPK